MFTYNINNMAQKIKYLQIDSQLRNNGEPYNFQIQINPAIYNVQSFKLVAFNMPNTYYNINSSNNILYFYDGSIQYQAILPPGAYDIVTLPPALEAAIQASGWDGSASVTFDDITLKLSITTNSLISLQFGTFDTNSIASILGFELLDTAFSLVNTANNVINLSIPPCVFIRINQMPVMVRSTSGVNGTFGIYIVSDSGVDSLFFDHSNYTMETGHNTNLCNVLDISLINPRDGSFFEISTDWSMMIELFY